MVIECRGVVDLFTLVLSLGTPQLRIVLSSCRKFGLFHQMLLVVNQVLVCGLLTVRIYALYNRSLRTLAYLLLSAAVLGAICAWALSDQDVHVEKTSCEVSLSKITYVTLPPLSCVATAWEALFIYDSIIFYFTIRRTWETWRSHSFRFTASSMPVVNLVLRDGDVMALATLSNIITFYVSIIFLPHSIFIITSCLLHLRLRGSLSTFASSISLIMVSRLMLNLHKSSHVGIFSTEPSIYLTTQFAPCDIESNCNTTTNNDTIYSPSATISG
ncbi:hypothetical protein AMATHDRAFT_147818 [Amanita thiersii Skay4041]|uniref:Uncharacterized protein n=1 Tax=Amanita thiersii Skay4041 TaxID=703135 RepID=A0A2A9NEF8_9AGAR|nr:hypothetical protein AMATHDRAFT_147818 [Amanita thiersii Skay4041]